MIKSVTLEEAAEIGVVRFYKGTGLDMLPWGPATEALVDCGWGSGPRQAILFAQRLCGATADGVVGPRTVEAYAAWVARVGWDHATREVCRIRKAFYDLIIAKNPVWEMYRRGWYNRAEWMLPGTEWGAAWASDPAPTPIVVTAPGKLPKQIEPQPVPPPRNTPKDSATVGNANKGAVAGTVAAGAAAAGPVVQAVAGADWKVAVVFGVIALAAIGGVLFYLLAIKKRRTAEIIAGIGD
jgi:lysozyme family protein